MFKILLSILLISSTLAGSNLTTSIEWIKKHEGFKSKPYIDASHFSVGYGTNLINGLTKQEAEMLLTMRLLNGYASLNQFKWFRKLNTTRQAVLMDMTYNIGIHGVLKFKRMIWALKHNYFHGAANEMKDSIWFRQVGTRGEFLYNKMRKGK